MTAADLNKPKLPIGRGLGAASHQWTRPGGRLVRARRGTGAGEPEEDDTALAGA
jgi:hypothetical protein